MCFYYPDAFVTCDPRDVEDHYVKRYPKLIAEILAPSTEEFDRGIKFQDYQSLDSLEEYVLIFQDEMRVECRRRFQSTGDQWETEIYGPGVGEATQNGHHVVLKSIGLEIAIADLYRGISLIA